MPAAPARAERNSTVTKTSVEPIFPISTCWRKAAAIAPATAPPIKKYRMPFIALLDPRQCWVARHGNSRDQRAPFADVLDDRLVATRLLGAAGRAGTAHIVQFRTVGVKRPGHELAPESPEFGRQSCDSGALRRGGKGCRT